MSPPIELVWSEVCGHVYHTLSWTKYTTEHYHCLICRFSSQAREAYEKALALEPQNDSLQQGLQKADVQLRKQEAEGKHTFKKRDLLGKPVASGTAKRPRTDATQGRKQKGLLSFDDDDGD